MSTQEQIGRLEELLARVQMRAQAARGAGVQGGEAAMAAPAPAAQMTPAPARARSAPQGAPPAYVTPPPSPAAHAPPATPTPPHDSPPAFPTPVPVAELDSLPPATPAHGEAAYDDDGSMEAELEISTETVEVDIDIDEPMPLESGAQPVAHATTPPEEIDEEAEALAQAAPTPPPPGPQEPEEVTQMVGANEVEEPTPSSSRRPIAGEEAEVEVEEESAPRHTPPPESGKQVAAAPSVHPPSRTSPSAPPPSLEGHTLIGGWREPGLHAPAGVPQVTPGAAAAAGVRVPAAPQMPAPAQASGTRLSPDVTRPELAAGGAGIATFGGPAPVAKPVTLGDLLDLTLGL